MPEPCASASLALFSQATGCAAILREPGGTLWEARSPHRSLPGLRPLNYGVRKLLLEGPGRPGSLKMGACVNWSQASAGLRRPQNQTLLLACPLGPPGTWESTHNGEPLAGSSRGSRRRDSAPSHRVLASRCVAEKPRRGLSSRGPQNLSDGAEGSRGVGRCPLPIANPVSSASFCSFQASPHAWGRQSPRGSRCLRGPILEKKEP